jgi:hypothetical protein
MTVKKSQILRSVGVGIQTFTTTLAPDHRFYAQGEGGGGGWSQPTHRCTNLPIGGELIFFYFSMSFFYLSPNRGRGGAEPGRHTPH